MVCSHKYEVGELGHHDVTSDRGYCCEVVVVVVVVLAVVTEVTLQKLRSSLAAHADARRSWRCYAITGLYSVADWGSDLQFPQK